MINPAKLIKLKTEKDRFVKRHPEFIQFLIEQLDNIQEGDEFDLICADNISDNGRKLICTEEDVQVFQMIGKLL